MKHRRNAKQNADSEGTQDKTSRELLRKSRDLSARPSVEQPDAELAHAGRIGAALGGLLARTSERDNKGRFTRDNAAHLTTLEHSSQLRAALEPLKRELIARMRIQLCADVEDAPETLLGVIDAYAEARLLRSSAFVRLAQLGGFMTSKGKARALLSTWGAAFDREMRAAEKLGLERKARHVNESIREALDRERAEREQQHDNEPAEIDCETGETQHDEHESEDR